MSYIDDIFNRLDLQQIRQFLQTGAELEKLDRGAYLERVQRARANAENVLKAKLRDENDLGKTVDEVFLHMSSVEDVYMEIGMKCGAVLTAQLLG